MTVPNPTTPGPGPAPTPGPAPAPAPTPVPEVLGVRRDVTVDAVTETAGVLGARRTAGEDGAQVLGARKGQTGDESLMFNYMLVLMALVMLVQLCVGDKRRVRR